jgi:hypothetical protein
MQLTYQVSRNLRGIYNQVEKLKVFFSSLSMAERKMWFLWDSQCQSESWDKTFTSEKKSKGKGKKS